MLSHALCKLTGFSFPNFTKCMLCFMQANCIYLKEYMQLFKIKADSCIKKENEYSTYLRGKSRFPFSFFFLKLSNLDGKDTKKT